MKELIHKRQSLNGKGVEHNSQPLRNQRKEKLKTLFGMSQGTDMDMYDFKFGKNSELKEIHKDAAEE